MLPPFFSFFLFLEPGRPMKTDKSAILVDAVRVLNQLKTESQEYKDTNEKLLEEIKTLKVRHRNLVQYSSVILVLVLSES